jgi:hypothetical protein
MARVKRGSRTLSLAEKRLAGLTAISVSLDLGNDLSSSRYAELIAAFRQKLAEYNTVLSVADALRLEVSALEKSLADLSEKMLVGVAHQYGKDSFEYARAGGVKKSERKPYRRRSVALATD